MTYETANQQLTGRCAQRRKLGNNTYLERRESGDIAIRLHATDVLTFHPDESYTVNTGGWQTITTKSRLNKYFPHGWILHQHKHMWYLTQYRNGTWTRDLPFRDPGTFDSAGLPTWDFKESNTQEEETKAIRKRIRAYVQGFQRALPVPLPSTGDCFFCAMTEQKSGKTLGDCQGDCSHILTHLDENYFVPSLLARAIRGKVGQIVFPACFKTEQGMSSFLDIARNQIRKPLTDYLEARLIHKRFE